MLGGSQQGVPGGGNDFVQLTGLWLSPKGNVSGTVKPDKFPVLFQLMKEAHSKGVGLVFIGVNAKEPKGKLVGTLYVTVAKPQTGQGQGGAALAPSPFAQAAPAPVPAAAPASPFDAAPATPAALQNPPKDELDSLLENL